MLREWLKRLGWFAVAGVVALLATEALTRALMPQSRDTVLEILAPDETVGYIYEPGARAVERARDYDVDFRINALGLRDREYAAAVDDAYRVLLVGNSFCVSHGLEIEDSMSRALERALRERFEAVGDARTVEVVNTCNGGYNPYNYWKSYGRWAPVFRPDAVVVGFLTSRDHRCDPPDVRFLVVDGLIRSRYREGEEPKIYRPNPATLVRKFLARSSDLYVLLRNYFYYNDRLQRIIGGVLGRDGSTRTVDPYRTTPTEAVESGRRQAFDYLARLRAETARDGVPLLILGIPVKGDVLDDAWSVVADEAAALAVPVDRRKPFRELAGWCGTATVPFVDLRPALRAAGPAGYFDHDNHWNAEGVAAAARVVAGEWDRVEASWPESAPPSP